jgi:hypothetical protein
MGLPPKSEVFLSAAALGTALAVAGLLAYETYALAEGKPPLTWHIRRTVRQHPNAAFAMSIGLGMLLGHLFWGGMSDQEEKWEAA